jgi:glycosyltransferase involved in cell wall biosynthesis
VKFLLGTHASNTHVQNLALALHEMDLLGAWETGWVDLSAAAGAGPARRWIGSRLPGLHRQLLRRKVLPALERYVRRNPGWEAARIAASRAGIFPLLTDWLHDRATFSLERRCARQMRNSAWGGFMGVEYGALAALRAARENGKIGIVAFLSPHHTFREKWVDGEYEKYPQLMTPALRRLLALGKARDRRRDEEMMAGDIVHTASRVTADSLIAAGVKRERVIVAPLGSPPPIAPEDLPKAPAGPVRILYAGQVSVGKGAHYLLQAWRALAPGRGAELHFCGKIVLPGDMLAGLPGSVFFHGPLLQSDLFRMYRGSSVLVFPTLCDGFGMVVTEALSQGLPVVTTSNAGANLLIEEGRNGFILPAADAQALSARLDWCLRNPEALHAMRPAALDASRRHNWDLFRATVRTQLSGFLAGQKVS